MKRKIFINWDIVQEVVLQQYWLQFLIQNTKTIQVYCLFLDKRQYYQSTFCFKKFLKIKAHLPVITTVDAPNMRVFLSKPSYRQQGGIRSSHREGATPSTPGETTATHLQSNSTASSPSSDSQLTLKKPNGWFLNTMSDTGTVTQEIGTQPHSIYFPLDLKKIFICFKGYAQLLCCLVDKDRLTMFIHSERHRA